MIGFITNPSIIMLNNEINIAIKKAARKLDIWKLLLPNIKLVKYSIMTLVSGYNNPQLIMVNGKVNTLRTGFIVWFKIYIMII